MVVWSARSNRSADLKTLECNSHPAVPRTLVVVDSRVPDRDTLLAGIDGAATIALVAPSEDGLQAVRELVASMAPVDALHLISHGTPGAVHLGATPITAEQLALNPVLLRGVRNGPLCGTGNAEMPGSFNCRIGGQQTI